MESRYISRKTNETSQYVYTNDIYDLTINNTNGNLAPNLEAKGNDATTVMRQLVEDLACTTLKLESLMNVFNECIKKGMIPEEIASYLSTYVYGTAAEPAKKQR